MILISLIFIIIFLPVCCLPTMMGYNGKLTCAVQSRKIKKNKHFPHHCREALISLHRRASRFLHRPARSQKSVTSPVPRPPKWLSKLASWLILARRCATNPVNNRLSMKSPVTGFRLWGRNVTSPVCGRCTCRRWRLRALTMANASSLFHR